MIGQGYDWYVDNLKAIAKSSRQWRKLLKSAKRSDSITDLEELRAAAQSIHDPHFFPKGKDGGWIGPQMEELVRVINARLRELRPKRPAPPTWAEPPGTFQGRDRRVVFEEAMKLKRAKKYAEAAVLFEGALGALEADVYAGEAIVTIDDYMQLAIVQRAMGDTEGEVRTLERYLHQNENDEVRGRLERLRKKMER